MVGGALVVAWIISRFLRRSATTLPHPALARPKAAGPSFDAEIRLCRDDLARQFSERLGFAIRTTSYGAVNIDPVHLAIWFMTDSNARRDGLLALPDFLQTCHAALVASGYPPGAEPHVHFGAASEETVQRDWGGNWRHFFK